MDAQDATPRTQRITNTKAFTVVMTLCWAAVFFDGIDTFMYGATIPSMIADGGFHMTEAHAGNIGSFATFGMLIGALGAGMLTDAIGRRWGIIVCCMLFSLGSVGCALAPTAGSFGVWRALAGLGLGGLLPTAIAMVSEFAHDSKRNFAIALVMTAHQAGGIMVPLLGISLMPAFGWRSLYWVGVLPLLIIVPLVLAYLPESLTFLMAKGRLDKARATAEKFDLVVPIRQSSIEPRAGSFGENFAKLFRGRNGLITILFWIGSFGGLLLVYGMSTWLPSLMKSLGYNLGSSLLFLCVINAGGVVGMLVAGRVSDALGPVKVSMVWFFITALGIFMLGVKVNMVVTYLSVFLTGAFLFSAQVMVYAAVAHVFPTEIRASAIGWTTGIGRFGAVFGPWMGGQLFASGHAHWGFAAFAAFAILSTIMLLLIHLVLRTTGGRAIGASGPENVVIQSPE